MFAVNPLDVVKIRLQAQHMPVKTSPVFVYHRGIVEEFCVCRYCASAGVTASISPALRPFNGTLVSLHRSGHLAKFGNLLSSDMTIRI